MLAQCVTAANGLRELDGVGEGALLVIDGMDVTISLLWAGGSAQGSTTLPDSVALDLSMAELVRAIAGGGGSALLRRVRFARQVLTELLSSRARRPMGRRSCGTCWSGRPCISSCSTPCPRGAHRREADDHGGLVTGDNGSRRG
jgi:hypothetical protein